MTTHIFRTAVGIVSVPHLRERQAARIEHEHDEIDQPFTTVRTRYQPKRANEILKSNGSLYWIIKGGIQARQSILGFDKTEESEGKSYCLIRLCPDVIRTEWKRHRHIQGWRYLEEENAPLDLHTGESEGVEKMPEEMINELQKLGLL